jgi:hypothetical protein
MSAPDDRVPLAEPCAPATMMKPVLILVVITLVGLACVLAMWWYFSTVTHAEGPAADPAQPPAVETPR